MTSSASTKYILARRASSAYDATNEDDTVGDMAYDQALEVGIWKVNASQQIGIATAQEAGLSSDRFPIRVVLGAAAESSRAVNTVVHYWRVTNSSDNPIQFQRKPLADDIGIVNLYALVPELDKKMWEHVRAIAGNTATDAYDAELIAFQTAAFNVLVARVLTDELRAAGRTALEGLFTACSARRLIVRIKVLDDVYIVSEPHGTVPTATKTWTSSRILSAEAMLCIKINYDRLKVRYDGVSPGVLVMAAYAISATFRYGLYECYENQEFFTAYVGPDGDNPKKFKVNTVTCPRHTARPSDLPDGLIIDLGSFKVSNRNLEIAPGLCITAGVNHYLFNHTTGGNIISGPLLSMLANSKLMNVGMDDNMRRRVTDVFYEALHPVNKRAVANLFFSKSRVTTHGKQASARVYTEFKPDAFVSLRLAPTPAGSHKAFVASNVMSRILDSGLAPFLPWASEIGEMATICDNVLAAGALSHLGCSYYTGMHGSTQPSQLDHYLPELAAFIQTLAKNDTIALSPHLGMDIAARSAISWSALLKELRGDDMSQADITKLRAYLKSGGQAYFDLDLDKPDTFTKATADALAMKARFARLLGN